MKNTFELHAFHILESYEEVDQIFNKDPSLEDKIVYLAIQRVLQTSAESCYKLLEWFKEKNSHIEWHKIKPFRNILVHDYLGNIDKIIIKDVILHDLPKIVVALEGEIPNWKEIKADTIEKNKKLTLKD